MIKFLRNLLASFTALVLFTGFIFFFFVMISISLGEQDKVVVKDNTILTIKLDRQIKDIQHKDEFAEMLFDAPASFIGLVELKTALNKAKEDDKIKGIVLDAPVVMAGYTTLEEVRNLIQDFKSSGKFVYAYTTIYTEKAYYLASVADKIFVTPEGMVEFNGIAANVSFFKGTLDKLGIKAQVFRVGEFKSAIEPFINTQMSPNNRLQLESMFGGIQQSINNKVAESRGLPVEKVNELVRTGAITTTKSAKKHGIIDDLLYDNEFRTFLKDTHFPESEINWMSIDKYPATTTSSSKDGKIAVLIADGEINYSRETGSSKDYIGQTYFLNQLRKIKEDDNIKALVLRVNSPGGSFIASDVLWKEITEVKKKKPVIASMGDYAASGGYYMAMAADTIMAQPNTITGSIGIFSVIFNMEGFLEDKMGITHDVVKTGATADMYNMSRPVTETEAKLYQASANSGYDTFTSKAALGRRLTQDSIKSIASGRVWTGKQAIHNGLVDLEGGIFDAIALAKERVGLASDARVVYYPKHKSFIDELFDTKKEQNAKILEKELADLYPYYMQLKSIQNLKGIQARLPYNIEIE